ncbi:unnamed protein product [Rotaria sp. Silwood2]|nr:unnamed protein product [Rotaria sp. Silwood2]CAF4406273.1 unnamed protein product [Rotaria sp. Silwood2]
MIPIQSHISHISTNAETLSISIKRFHAFEKKTSESPRPLIESIAMVNSIDTIPSIPINRNDTFFSKFESFPSLPIETILSIKSADIQY